MTIAPTLFGLSKKVQIKCWIQRHVRAQMRGKGSKVCRGPHAYREAGAPAQPQQGSLDAEGLPSWAKAGSGLLSWITGGGDHQPSHSCRSLPAALPCLQLTCSVLHYSPLATSTWAETKHSRSKRKAKPRDSWRDTERPTGYILSLGSLFFSLSFMTVQFLSPQQRTKLFILLTEREEIRGSHIPMHPSRKKNHCLRSLFFQ